MRLPKGPTPDRINQIQTALARGGYYQGDPTGKWDSNTIAATEKFQSANGLDSTGKLDAAKAGPRLEYRGRFGAQARVAKVLRGAIDLDVPAAG
jgi:peptidoglycan hydrolase-like protein with peptidoglycan-binding domain